MGAMNLLLFGSALETAFVIDWCTTEHIVVTCISPTRTSLPGILPLIDKMTNMSTICTFFMLFIDSKHLHSVDYDFLNYVNHLELSFLFWIHETLVSHYHCIWSLDSNVFSLTRHNCLVSFIHMRCSWCFSFLILFLCITRHLWVALKPFPSFLGCKAADVFLLSMLVCPVLTDTTVSFLTLDSFLFFCFPAVRSGCFGSIESTIFSFLMIRDIH